MKTWTYEHEINLVREVLAVNPFKHAEGTSERAKLWEEIASNLNGIESLKFEVTVRSVRDHVNLVLLKRHKQKIASEEKASGITVGEATEMEIALENIQDLSDESDRVKETLSLERRRKLENDQKQAQEMRLKALEKVGETKKRVSGDIEEGESISTTRKRARRNGKETINYLQEKNEKEMGVRKEELELKKKQLSLQEKQQRQMADQLAQQQQQQGAMFLAFQQQQQQQYQLQQQQNQAMLAILQQLTKNK